MFFLLGCVIIFLISAGFCIEILQQKHNKYLHGGPENKLRWYYRFRKYSIDIPPANLSTQYLKYHTSDRKSLPYFGTIDDPVLKQIAEDFNDLFSRKSDIFKAHCLQALVQQNVSYASDLSRFGVENCWCFPIRTLMTKTGDCEDSALLYAGLGTCIGLDVVLVCFPRHMLCTVFPKEGDFIPVELTGYLPFSFSAMDVTLGDWETLEQPDKDFLEKTERY